ncbi:MAG: hypothetical protein Kow0059_07850 [Candidatus Sumerlaeia bacterium]
MNRVSLVTLCTVAWTVGCVLAGAPVQAAHVEFNRAPDVARFQGHPRIQSNLSQIVEGEKAKAAGRSSSAESGGRLPVQLVPPQGSLCNDHIQVYLEMADMSESALAALEAEGAEIELVSEDLNLVQAVVPVEAVELIADLNPVLRVRLPDYGTSNVGAMTTEGDLWGKTLELRRLLGLTGAGQEIVVFSDGFDDGTSVTVRLFREGDLPDRDILPEYLWCFGYPDLFSQYPPVPAPRVFTRFGDVRLFGPFTLPTSIYSKGAEGAAVMEVAHDLAPAATLYFAAVRKSTLDCATQSQATTLNLITARQQMMMHISNSQMNPSVVIDTFSFFNVGPYDGSSAISFDATSISNNLQRPYVISAGNFAQQHWSGVFTEDPQNVNGIHNFRLRQGVIPGDETLEIEIQPGDTAEIYLLWNDTWDAPQDDIDLWALDPETLDFNNPVAFSTDFQLPILRNPPVEQICSLRNSGGLTGTEVARLSIVLTRKRPSASPSPRIDLFVKGATIVEKDYIVPEGSIPNNADADSPWIVTVGAVDVASMPNARLEEFSSRGPTVDGRMKPDFVSFDNVSVNSTHLNPFRGTSAAAAHVGGLLALAGEHVPTSDFLTNLPLLQDTALDLGEAGPDNLYGYGLLDPTAFILKYFNPSTRATGHYYTTFSSNTSEGWVFGHAASSGLTPPGYGVQDGALYLEVLDPKTFGFWQLDSPVLDGATNRRTTQAGKLYEIRYRIRTDQPSNSFPDFRLRVGTLTGQEFAVMLVQNGPVASQYPTPDGRDYILHYLVNDPAAAGQELTLSFDVLGFEPHVPPGARVYLDEIEVLELTPPSLP